MGRDTEFDSTVGPAPKQKKRSRKGRPGFFLLFCTLFYALALLVVTISNVAGPERWWFGSLNLYFPQWPWALPCIVLLPWYLLSAWRWTWIPLLLVAWVFGPIMGFCLNTGSITTPRGGLRLRVMTYNIKWGYRDAPAALDNIAKAQPDVLLLQDAGAALDGALRPLRNYGWHEAAMGQYVILSRYPLTDLEERWITPEHTHTCMRCILHAGKTPIVLYDVHLTTPRWALGAVQENGAEAMGSLEENVTVRQIQATMVAAHVEGENGPVILTGDLNAPVQSRACRKLLDVGLRDAFSETGWGYGFTYGQSTPIQQPFMRIDHLMVSPQWDILSCKVGSPRGSDHTPVIADIVLPDSHQ